MPVLSIEGTRILEKEKKRKKKLASMYDIAEDEKEENSEGEEGAEADKSEEESISHEIAVPYPNILTRAIEEMNHAEAEEEVGDALMLMMETLREQTDNLQQRFGVEESKVPSIINSSTKRSTRSTYQPSESMSAYGGTQSRLNASVISTGAPKTERALKFENKQDKIEDRKLDRIAAEAQAFLLNNQKKGMMSDSESVASLGKVTASGAPALSVKSMGKASVGTSKGPNSVASAKTQSFSKAGKALTRKF